MKLIINSLFYYFKSVIFCQDVTFGLSLVIDGMKEMIRTSKICPWGESLGLS